MIGTMHFRARQVRHQITEGQGHAQLILHVQAIARSVLLAIIGVTLATGLARAADQDPGNRVVCVSKQLNEFIFALGAEKSLVGRDLTSIYPPAIQAIPSVGYHRALSADGIVSLKPSVFLTDGNVGPDQVLDRLRDVGIPIMVMKPDDTVAGAQDLMLRLGAYFHKESQAADLVARWKKDMDTLPQVEANARRPRVLMIHFGQSSNAYLALGQGGAAEQVLRWAGGQNAIDKVGGMTRLTPEVIAQTGAETIIATDVGYDRYGSAEKFAELPGISLTPAGQAGRIYRIDETDLMYYGPRTADAVRRIAAMLRP
jgi:iron complex transport system substrate-binding protein